MTDRKIGSVPMQPQVMPYGWGGRAGCLVHRLAGRSLPATQNADSFAEAWYGDHPSGPATALLPDGQQVPLPELLERHPSLFGGRELKLGDAKRMPFLAKVLAIKSDPPTPLSIQLHPPREHAERLYRYSQDNQTELRRTGRPIYSDPLPKDEAAVALEPVELLCGFRPRAEIEKVLDAFPELRTLLGNPSIADGEHYNRAICSALFAAPLPKLRETCRTLAASMEQQSGSLTRSEEWVQVLLAQYPEGDVGAIFPLLLNLLRLQPGEAVSIPCGRIHAYLSGALAEVMRPSDNVIRCGITPKEKDPEEMMRCGEFTSLDPRQAVLSGIEAGGATSYDFGCDAFTIKILTALGRPTRHCLPGSRPSVLVSLDAVGGLKTPFDEHEISPAAAFLISGECDESEVWVSSGKCALYTLP